MTDGNETHIDRMANLRPGDLVLTIDGYYGVMLDDFADSRDQYLVAMGNGVEQFVNWGDVFAVLTLPGGGAHVNFREWLRTKEVP